MYTMYIFSTVHVHVQYSMCTCSVHVHGCLMKEVLYLVPIPKYLPLLQFLLLLLQFPCLIKCSICQTNS